MNNEQKIKLFLGAIYLLIISIFLWFFFSNFTIDEISSYQFIKYNRDKLIDFKNSNFLLVGFIFLISTIFWILLLGFASPVCLLGGFIFGKWFGTIIVALGLSIGATLVYIIANFFFKEFVEEKFSKKFNYLIEKFKKNEFIYFLIYRFIGGIPFFISNILPTLFNIKTNVFFLGSLLGMIPQLFVWVSLGSGLEKIINNNLEPPTLIQLIFSSEIIIPILGFLLLLILGIIVKNLYLKK